MTVFSPRLERNAIPFPSGDQRGCVADDSPNVAGQDSRPSVVASQICVRYSLRSGSITDSRTT